MIWVLTKCWGECCLEKMSVGYINISENMNSAEITSVRSRCPVMVIVEKFLLVKA